MRTRKLWVGGIISVITVSILLLSSATAVIAPLKIEAEERVIDVDIKNFAFNPNDITVFVNEKVIFRVTNSDSASHTLTIDNGSKPEVVLSGGQTKNLTFITPSTPQDIGFYCRFHPSMTGNIRIDEKTTISSSTATTNPIDFTSATTISNGNNTITTTASNDLTTTTGTSATAPGFMTIITMFSLLVAVLVLRNKIKK